MSAFLSPLDLREADEKDDGQWILGSPLVYQSDIAGVTFTVPAGFRTDLASVPRIPIVYELTGGTSSKAAVVHDWLYTTKLVARDVADAVLREASAVTGVPAWRRNLMFCGVRAFGWSHWK
ncbi:DUF1353 domain-containing protein [Caballeronia sp. NCTM1]|uniref:DUF1353 domain-containing protein n=1 Tax=Caballeronia sp. NCTM1 TaxID=2921753 RepID=UPI002027E584|nr:DUF1353 domain-containing protein [Caballeronia sp. NCTM1]